MSIKLTLILPLYILLCGCTVSSTNTIASMPSLSTGSTNETVKIDTRLPSTVAVLPFANKTNSDFAYDVVRQTMFNHFSSKNYRMLPWQDVDSRLKLAGIENDAALKALTPGKLGEILGVDGLIYGNITNYDKTFAGIAARVTVGVELEFIDSQGNLLWKINEVKKSYAGGISTTPVGLILNALVAAKHIIGDVNLYRAADELGRELAKQMPAPPNISQRKSPAIVTVVHSGVGQALRYGDILEIALEGDAGLTAVADIQGIGLIDLEEITPGQYFAQYAVKNTDNISNAIIIGRLQDSFAQTTSWTSPFGLVNLDNIRPGQVSELVMQSRDSTVTLNWQSAQDSDVTDYVITIANTETGEAKQTFHSPNSKYILSSLTNFETVYVTVSAKDQAGNIGAGRQIEVTAAPDPRYAGATTIKSDIPAVISGVMKLSPAGNPHYLRNESRIATDGVLLIAPGVEIFVSPGGKIAVLGELHTFGNAQAPIKVSAANNQAYDAFLVLQSTSPITISGLHVDGAGIPIAIKAGNPLIDASQLIHCQFNCITIEGTAKPRVTNSLFSDAMASGVIVSGQAQPIFKGNRFINNSPFQLQNSSTYAIDAEDNEWQPAASAMTVLGDVSY